MPNLIVPVATSLAGAATRTALSEGLRSPKAIALFYVEVTKSCSSATGSKRIACIAAAGVCRVALMSGPHQAPFLGSCAASLRGINKL